MTCLGILLGILVLSGIYYIRTAAPGGAASEKSRESTGAIGTSVPANAADTNKRQSAVPLRTPGVAEDSLPLTQIPLPSTSKELTLQAEISLRGLEAEKSWRAEDRIAQSWPAYTGVREQLKKGLGATIDLEEASVEELTQLAAVLREKFWQAGGRGTLEAYLPIYEARILLEAAHARWPQNALVTDDLVETILCACPLLQYHGDSKYATSDRQVLQELRALRLEQFTLLRNQNQGGPKLEFQDFLRTCDLAYLNMFFGGSREVALGAVDWLLENETRGGWSFYHGSLQKLRDSIQQHTGYAFTIMLARDPRNDSASYQRRLPSFRGPKQRDLIATKDVPHLTTIRSSIRQQWEK